MCAWCDPVEARKNDKNKELRASWGKIKVKIQQKKIFRIFLRIVLIGKVSMIFFLAAAVFTLLDIKSQTRDETIFDLRSSS